MAKGSFGRSFGKSSGGIGGTGVHGVVGSTTVCSSTDNSFYCRFVKFVNVIAMVIFLVLVAVYIYSFFSAKSR
jgi:hypothetical protein